MAMDDVLLSGAMQVADEVYLLELWRPATDPPYRTTETVARFEGGVVDSVDGVSVDLLHVRQAIDPATGEPSLATALTADHTGRLSMAWTAVGDSAVYTIVSHDAGSLTLDRAPGWPVGTVVVICDHVRPMDVSCDRDIDSFAANARAAFQDGDRETGDPGPLGRISSMSWLFWRKRCWSDRGNSGWFSAGLFCVNGDPEEARPGSHSLSISALDALKWSQIKPFVGRFSADRIAAHDTTAGAEACVWLKPVVEGTGADALHRFFDSPADSGDDAALQADHTFNWCKLPPILLYKSANTNASISATDELVSQTDGSVQVLYGSGEVRVTHGWYTQSMLPDAPDDDGYTGFVETYAGEDPPAFPYLKARYYRWTNPADVRRGIVTGISGAVVTCSGFSGAVALTTTGPGVVGRTVRFTSGAARGQRFAVTANSSTAVTVDSAPAAAIGDTFEVGDLNDPAFVIEDVLADAGFQGIDAHLPLHVDALDPVLTPDTAAAVLHYDASWAAWTDLTDDLADETLGATVTGDSADYLAIGHTSRYGFLYASLSTPAWTGGVMVHEYWNGASWAALPSLGYADATAALTTSGLLRWNHPANWKPVSLHGSEMLFWTRLRASSAFTGSAHLKRVQVLDRVSLPSPTEYRVEENRTAENVVSDLRGKNLLLPNWILFADTAGRVQGRSVVQAGTARWAADKLTSLRHERNDDQIITGVLYRGWSDAIDNLAVAGPTVSIAPCPELVARLGTLFGGTDASASGFGDLMVAESSDHRRGLACLLSGIDQRELHNHGAFVDAYGYDWFNGGWDYRWGVATHDWSDRQMINELPIWQIDLSTVTTSLNELRIVLDDRVKGNLRYHAIATSNPPIVTLEVSSDASLWVPLCDPAAAITLDRDKLHEVRLSKGDGGWQDTWRYLRLTCLRSGEWKTWSHHALRAHTGCVAALKLYRNQELTESLYLGETAPLNGTSYQARLRRFGRRLHVVSAIDYSADTPAKVHEKGVALLRELSYELPEVTLDGVRPDVQLFDTVAVTYPRRGYFGRRFLLLSAHVGRGAAVSFRAQDTTVLDD